MPITPTYPGVYIEEVPSGVKTIVGTGTAITAFVGSSVKGPVNEPKTIFNYGDYETIFGGLDNNHKMSFSLEDYFLNGGQQAIIVRAAKDDHATAEIAIDSGSKIKIMASSPGAWGNDLKVEVTTVENLPSDYVAANYFALVVKDQDQEVESYPLLTADSADHANNLVNILKASSYIRASVEADADVTAVTKDGAAVALAGGADGAPLDMAAIEGSQPDKTGIYALLKADLFTMLCIPPYLANGDVDAALVTKAAKFCEDERAFMLLDAPVAWVTKDTAKAGMAAGDGHGRGRKRR